MGNIQILLTKSVDIFFWVIESLILVRIILSWFPMRPNQIMTFVYNLTEPILGPARKMLDKSPLGGGMMIDFSPIIALFLLSLAKAILTSLIQLL